MSNDYNLIDGPAGIVVPGPHTVTAPARLVAPSAPRLRSDSPAIDAADGATLANLIVEAGLTTLDADGLRRFKLANADIGAYEFGDVSLQHVTRSENISDHLTYLDHAASNDNPNALVLATPVYRNAARLFDPFGVYYETSRWSVYTENFAAMPVNVGLNAWLPAPGGGAFIHLGTAANSSGPATRIDNGSTNGRADQIILVTHNWTATSTYNPHLIGLNYTGAGSAGRWQIANLDLAPLPATSAFNVYAQPPSPNAFRVQAPAGALRLDLDHPLINDVACANVHASRVMPVGDPGPVASFDLDYNPGAGRWGIYSPTAFVAGTAFNIVIDPAQVFDCNDRIFANDFE